MHRRTKQCRALTSASYAQENPTVKSISISHLCTGEPNNVRALASATYGQVNQTVRALASATYAQENQNSVED